MWSAEARAEATGRRGTRQDERFPAALADDYFLPDELSFEQLLALAVEHARLLRFPDADQDPERGDWEDLLLADEALLVARIVALDLMALNRDFRNFLTSYRRGGLAPDDIPAYRLARQLDDWSARLSALRGHRAAGLARQLEALISPTLVRAMEELVSFLAWEDAHLAQALRAGLSPRWIASPLAPEGLSGGENEARERFLGENFQVFCQAASALKHAASRTLAESLGSGGHDPAAGLYMAFASLYRKVQAVANRFTRRHLDFYYREVLGFRPRPAVADHTYLVLAQDGRAPHVAVPKGTAFSAGIDESGTALVFTADQDASIGKLRIAELRTLFFEKNPLISPEREFGLATAGKSAFIPVDGDTTAAGNNRAWPLFGAPKPDAGQAPGEDATLGFALSSPVLLLREGHRDIDLRFHLSLEDPEVPGQMENGRAHQADASLARWLRDLAEATQTTPLDAFVKTFRGMFRISVTTPRGWRDLDEYLPRTDALEPGHGPSSLGIQIRLGPDAEALVPYTPAIHGEGYETDFPVLRFSLNPATYLYPYTLLSRMLVHQVEILVSVRGLKNLLVYNQLGQLDANTPFTPFGPLPTLGSYFQIGSQEAAGKHLTDLELELEWADLPQGRGGFPAHYAAYDQPPGNEDFRVSISALKGGDWLPGDRGRQPVSPLFSDQQDTQVPPGTLCRRQTVSCRLVVPLTRPSPQVLEGGELAYTPYAKDGFFRFTLCSPDGAFGHRAYPPLLTRVLSDNARLRRARLQKPVPQAPYTPLISSLAVNYRATATLSLDRMTHLAPLRMGEGEYGPGGLDRLFHLHPFGVERVDPRSHRRISLLPRYPAQGHLLIGLAGDDPAGPLNLLFHLREDAIPDPARRPDTPIWWYLAGNRWRRLDPTRVRADGTRGFQSTGIVEMELPGNMDKHHTIMPAGMYWLGVSMDRHPESPCSAYGIHAQALRVSRRLDDSASYAGGELPRGRIHTPLNALPGIIRISQPLPSGGGTPPEAATRFQARMGERLRHKNRACLPWDYERLVLDRFPGIHMVKCFSNLVDDPDPASQVRPGHLLVVVVPHLERGASPHLRPQADRLLLEEIRDYLAGLASPFARIAVRNADYELIQVRCAVRLSPGAAGDQLRALNQALCDYLSPWKTDGYDMRFGWRLRTLDMQSHLRSLPGVEMVTRFSLLRVAGLGQDLFQLDDSVEENGDQLPDLAPLQPWNLAVSFPQHHIEILDIPVPLPPRRTGLGQLQIGANLIIS